MTPERREELTATIQAELDDIRKQERMLTARRCAEIAEKLSAAHGEAYEKAEGVADATTLEFIAGMRDGGRGVRNAIRREFGLDGEGK